MDRNLPQVALNYFFRQSFSGETSLTPELWTPENPSQGHCVLCALTTQDIYGGKIVRGLLPQIWQEKLGFRSHYWNVLDSGAIVDFSRKQFPPDFPYDELVSRQVSPEDKRGYVLSHPGTVERYKEFRIKVDRVFISNPLFQDDKFMRSWKLAFSGESICPRMRFACLVFEGDELIAESTNKLFTTRFGKERWCSFDGVKCERDKKNIQSRMDATIGDCGHAPIWCLRKVFELGYKPSQLPSLNFYEGGFYADGSPWWRDEANYTCTYCENMFAIFGLDKIWGAFDSAWHPLYTCDSLYSAVDYAQGLKKA